MKTKLLKIKVGEVYIDGKNYDVFQNAWQKQSEKGVIYYESRNVIFVHEVEKQKEEDNPITA